MQVNALLLLVVTGRDSMFFFKLLDLFFLSTAINSVSINSIPDTRTIFCEENIFHEELPLLDYDEGKCVLQIPFTSRT